MAKTKISEFSATPGNNTDIDGINLAEGCAPSGINDAIRELMAQLKDFQAGTAGDSFNGPVGTTTAAAGAFTTLSASSTVSGAGFSTYLASPPAIGGTTAAAGSFTTLTTSSTVTLSGGTANGVAYLNGSKVLTTGSALTFDGTNFGIGTNTLTYTLNVAAPSARSTFTSTAGTSSVWQNHVNTGGNFYIGIENSAGTTFGTTAYASVLWSTGATPFVFATSGSEQMRLTSTGLGIGTSSPAYKLDVLSTAFTIGRFSRSGAGGSAAIDLVEGSGGYVRLACDGGTNNFSIRPAGTTTATFDSSGNLGLGVTPSAWWSSTKAMQIGAGGVIAGRTDTAARNYFASNAYLNATPAWTYIATNYATRYEQNDGQHQWYTAPSGTAGNAISFTQAMTLDATGRLLVGVTSGSYALDVGDVSGGNMFRFTRSGVEVSSFISAGLPYFGTTSNTDLVLMTNSTGRARITSGGYFKASNNGTYLGSTGTYHELTASGADADYIVNITTPVATAANCYGARVYYSGAAPNGTGNVFLSCQDNAATRATIRSNGGIANYQANNVDLSDARTKKEINPAASMWSKIGALEIVTYKYNDQTHDDVNLGVIAQQVETVEPVWVDADGFGETPEDGIPFKTVYTKDIYFAAIKALQEAMKRIEELERRLAAAGI